MFRCTSPESAQAWVEAQRRRWQVRSRRYGARAADQLHPCATLHYVPPQANGTPLLLLGGMGPMAGLVGFEQAHTFDPQREIILHQACLLPCRTRAIKAEQCGDPAPAMELLAALGRALDGLLPLGRHDAELLVLCNTVHHFLGRLTEGLPKGIRLRPLPDAAIATASILAPQRLMLLTSEGSRLAGIYARRATVAGLRWCEPDAVEDALLQRAIFDGVKRGDRQALLAAGDTLFRRLARRRPAPDALLAGCTEIPIILDMLRRHGSPDTRAYLASVDIIDPVAEALRGAAHAPATPETCGHSALFDRFRDAVTPHSNRLLEAET